MTTVRSAETLVSAPHDAPRPLKPKLGSRSVRNYEKNVFLSYTCLVSGTRYRRSCHSRREEGIRGHRGTGEHIVSLGTSEASGQYHATADLSPRETAPGAHCMGRWVGPRTGLVLAIRKFYCCAGVRTKDRPACCLVTIPLNCRGSHGWDKSFLGMSFIKPWKTRVSDMELLIGHIGRYSNVASKVKLS